MKKCHMCGVEETDKYLEQVGELIKVEYKTYRGGEIYTQYLCEDCNSRYFPKE